MKYSIGEFASIIGVTVDTLRLYEKHGIIKPIKNTENNYRYFSDLDARNLLTSRWYRSIQIPLQETASLTQDATIECIIDKIQKTEGILEEEIKKKTMLLNKIKEIKADFGKIKTTHGLCMLKDLPGIFRLKQTNRNVLLQEESLRDMVNSWMEILPYTFFSFRINQNEFSLDKNHLEYSWGVAIYEDEMYDFSIEMNEKVEYIKPKTYISAVVCSCEEEHITRDSLQFMIDYIKDNNYVITGDVIGKLLLNEKISGRNISYIEVNIPI